MGNHEQHYSPAVFRHICRPYTLAFTDTLSMDIRMRTPFVVVHLELSVSYFCIFFLLRIHKQCQDETPKNIFRPDGHQHIPVIYWIYRGTKLWQKRAHLTSKNRKYIPVIYWIYYGTKLWQTRAHLMSKNRIIFARDDQLKSENKQVEVINAPD